MGGCIAEWTVVDVETTRASDGQRAVELLTILRQKAGLTWLFNDDDDDVAAAVPSSALWPPLVQFLMSQLKPDSVAADTSTSSPFRTSGSSRMTSLVKASAPPSAFSDGSDQVGSLLNCIVSLSTILQESVIDYVPELPISASTLCSTLLRLTYALAPLQLPDLILVFGSISFVVDASSYSQ